MVLGDFKAAVEFGGRPQANEFDRTEQRLLCFLEPVLDDENLGLQIIGAAQSDMVFDTGGEVVNKRLILV